MDIKAEEISKIIREQIGSFAVDVDVAEVGTIVSIGDGIARSMAWKTRWPARCSSSPTASTASR